MSISAFFVAIASELLLPPLSLLFLAALGGVLLLTRHQRSGRWLVTMSLVLLTLLSVPYTAGWLSDLVESESAALASPTDADADAIVVLGGSRIIAAPEYGGSDQPNAPTMMRLRYGAWLNRQTGLPILVSGGSPRGEPEPESTLMARVLRDDFKVPVRWEEGRSRNTAENAINSAAILRQAGVRRILLVTDAMHMPRSRRIFAATGLDVIPAPVRLASSPSAGTTLAFLPQSRTLDRSAYALRELIGMLWYRLRYQKLDSALAASGSA